MAKVFYIPYAKYELRSELTREELIAKLRNQISNHNFIGELATKNKRKFSSSINPTTGEFHIKKRLQFRNNFNSNLKGRIVKSEIGSKIIITLKLSTFSYIFLVIFIILWILSTPQVRTLEDLVWPLGGLSFVYILIFLTFNMGASEALDTLHELVKPIAA